MASLRMLMVILGAVVALSSIDAAPARQALSSFVTNTDLGDIYPVTEKKILNAFVALNPALPERLRDTRVKSKYLRAFPIYPDGRALIHVLSTAGGYTGALEVYFNGGRPATRNFVEDAVSLDQSRLSLDRLPPLASEAQIIDAYLAHNGNLPRSLRAELRVRPVARGRAVVYVGSPRSRYHGSVPVKW